MSKQTTRSREDVVSDFALESPTDKATLMRYIKMYPDYTEDLIDMARELSRESSLVDRLLTDVDDNKIQSAWIQHTSARSVSTVNPFDALTLERRTEIVTALDIPRQVLTALRECRVLLNSIPNPFLIKLAQLTAVTVDELSAALSNPPELNTKRSYKSEVVPNASAQVTLEQLLIDAGVSEEQRATLLREID